MMDAMLVNGQRVESGYRLQAGDEIAICPTGSRNADPIRFPDDGSIVPELLTADEACRFLRLFEQSWAGACDKAGSWPDDPKAATGLRDGAMRLAREKLKYIADPGRAGHLRPTKVGNRNMYARVELMRFIDPATD